MLPPSSALAAPPDDAAAAVLELNCPLCRYSLRGLTDPRCPECGFAFTWAELVDARRDRHPWLFEHARRPWSPPRRALRLTAWRAGVRPWRFWRDVSPTNPVRLRRLVLYWAITNLPLVLLAGLGIGSAFAVQARQVAAFRAWWTPVSGQPGRFVAGGRSFADQTQLDTWYPRPWSAAFLRQSWRWSTGRQAGALLAAAVVAAAWPWLTAAALAASFRWSLRQTKVDVRHVLRTAIYAADVGLLGTVAAVALYGPGSVCGPVMGLAQPWLPSGWTVPGWVTAKGLQATPLATPFATYEYWPYRGDGPLGAAGVPLLAVLLVPFAAVTTVRLAVAVRLYLRFDRPVATAFATQVIVVLVVIVAILQLTRWV